MREKQASASSGRETFSRYTLPVRASQLSALAIAAVLGACGGENTTAPPPDPPPAPGACAAGTLAQQDGSCLPAGVAACAEGFAPDGAGGCEVVLPPSSCDPGQMAVPGDPACRLVSSCDAGPYGDAPEEPGTQHVDAAYTGGQNDGTLAHPWTTIAQGIGAAQAGAVVAVAAGVYPEVVRLSKSVRLWGRCASRVEVGTVALMVSDVEVHALASKSAVLAYKGQRLLADRLWVHDTPGFGFGVDSGAEATLRDSLVEGANGTGVALLGGDLRMERTLVRDTKVDADGARGEGVRAERSTTGRPSKLAVVGSVVERNLGLGIIAVGCDASVEGTVVRDTRERPKDQSLGRGISVESDSTAAGVRGTLAVRGSLVERSVEMGIAAIGADAVVEDTVVRDTAARPTDAYFGAGLYVAPNPTTRDPGALTVRRSLFARNHWAGVLVSAASATIESTLVLDTLPTTYLELGAGILVSEQQRDDLPDATAQVRGSVVRDARLAGIFVAGGTADVEGSLVVGSQAETGGSFGDGVTVMSILRPGAVHLRDTRVETSARGGLAVFGASAAVRSTQFECNAIALATEEDKGKSAALVDDGGNSCGCGDKRIKCAALSSQLTPPARPPSL